MVSYSAISGSDGGYSLPVEAGIYTVTISKTRYQPVTITNVNATNDVDLGVSTLALMPGTSTPWGPTMLDAGIYRITLPAQTVINNQTYKFKQWEDGSTNPIRTINLTSDLSLMATYELVVSPPTLPKILGLWNFPIISMALVRWAEFKRRRAQR